MRLEDLWAKDEQFRAFSGFIPVSEAKKQGIIPEVYHDTELGRDFCDCGSERIIRLNRSTLMCCDPRCRIKMGHTLDYLFDKFNCKNIGEKTCASIVDYAFKYLKETSIIKILDYSIGKMPPDLGSMQFSHFQSAVAKVKSAELTFPQIVVSLGIPSFGDGAAYIFEGINSTEELLDKITFYGGVSEFLAAKGVQDPMKGFYLNEFLPDIAYAEYYIFKKKAPVSSVTIPICITGELRVLGRRMTKEEFVALCNSIGRLTPNFSLFYIVRNDAVNTNRYIIADYESTNSKYLVASRRQKALEDSYASQGRELKFEDNILFKGEDFLRLLKALADKARLEMGIPIPDKDKEEQDVRDSWNFS